MNAFSRLQNLRCAETISGIISAYGAFCKGEEAFMLCRRCGLPKVLKMVTGLPLRAKFQSRLTTNLPKLLIYGPPDPTADFIVARRNSNSIVTTEIQKNCRLSIRAFIPLKKFFAHILPHFSDHPNGSISTSRLLPPPRCIYR
jgi:hypothetical protein